MAVPWRGFHYPCHQRVHEQSAGQPFQNSSTYSTIFAGIKMDNKGKLSLDKTKVR